MAQSDQQASLTGLLMQLRVKAKARRGEWAKKELSRGLRLAWRTDADGGEMLVLNRIFAQPSDQEVRTVIESVHALDDRLGPATLRRKDRTVVIRLVTRMCYHCPYPIDVDAKMEASRLCSVCKKPGKTRCRDCGEECSTEVAAFIGFCAHCANARRAKLGKLGTGGG